MPARTSSIMQADAIDWQLIVQSLVFSNSANQKQVRSLPPIADAMSQQALMWQEVPLTIACPHVWQILALPQDKLVLAPLKRLCHGLSQQLLSGNKTVCSRC